jgi:hypothetical protein
LFKYYDDSMAFSMTASRYSHLAADDLAGRSAAPFPESVVEAAEGTSESELLGQVLRLVKAHPDGLSTSDIARAAEATHPRVSRALLRLEREREIYSTSLRGGSMKVWFPNGRLVHPYLETFKDIRGRTYRLSVQDARYGSAVQIQERSFSVLSGEKVEGAVFVDYRGVDDLIAGLTELKTRFERWEAERRVGK